VLLVFNDSGEVVLSKSMSKTKTNLFAELNKLTGAQ
jgi:hypothetical protein